MPHAPAFACLIILAAITAPPNRSASAACPTFFVSSQQPTLINPKLAQDT